MGGSASKAARKLPTTTPSVTRAATAPHPPPQAAPPPQAEAFDYGRPRKSEPFSGEKDDALIRDSGDPHLLANLAALGQVKVPTGTFISPDRGVAQRTLKARRDEYTNPRATPPPGMLGAVQMSSMFDELKIRGRDVVAKRYGMDPADVELLAKWINSPSVAGEERTMVQRGQQVEEVLEMKAVWVDGKK